MWVGVGGIYGGYGGGLVFKILNVLHIFLARAYIRGLINGILRYFKQVFLGTTLHGFF